MNAMEYLCASCGQVWDRRFQPEYIWDDKSICQDCYPQVLQLSARQCGVSVWEEFQKLALRVALRRSHGNARLAYQWLGISKNTFYAKRAYFGL